MNAILNAKAVDDVMKSVLFKPEEVPDGKPPADAVIVEGLMAKFAFHPGRLNEAKPKIVAMLSELPEQFGKSKGGGWSFLNGCMDRNDNQWGEQRDVDHLVVLGIGIGAASWMLRDMMSALPGGVPYFEVHPEAVQVAA